MSASIVELMLMGLVVAGAVVAAAAGGVFLLWRYGRRKLRAVRSHTAVVVAVALWETAGSLRWRRSSLAATRDVDGWPAHRVRREVWRSVERATSAVRAADEVGGPTAELPSLCRRLHAAALDLDKLLRIDPRAPVAASVAAQAGELLAAADDVQRAALSSASDASGWRVRELALDAGHELGILDAGLATFRGSPPPITR